MEYDKHFAFKLSGKEYYATHVTDDTHMGEDYIPVRDRTGVWYVFAPLVGDVVQLACLAEPFDYAVPQGWLDASRQLVADHGGWVIWSYASSLLGEPLFADDCIRMAKQTIRAMVAEHT